MQTGLLAGCRQILPHFSELTGKNCRLLEQSPLIGSGNGYPGRGTLLRRSFPKWRVAPSEKVRLDLVAQVLLHSLSSATPIAFATS